MSKKKLLVLSSYGGYGHIAATNTLKKLLSEEYDIDVAYPIKELRMFKLPAAESIYNWLLSSNLYGLTNWIVKYIARALFSSRTQKTTRLIQERIREKGSDLLISLVPFVNFPASEAARLSEIPFLMITTDNDLENWVFDLEKMKISNFKVTVGSHLATTVGALKKKGISEKHIEETGLPLRPGFTRVESKKSLRAKYEIPEGKNTVLIMMGGAGSKTVVKYVKALIAHSMNLHVIVCLGRNRSLSKKLKRLRAATGNGVEVIPFTEKVYELLALSDLLITKPGPGSVSEAYALKLPILLDRTKPPIFWEEANIELVLRDRVGASIESFEETPDLVARFLFDEQTREAVDRAYLEIPKNRFSEAIGPILAEMIGSSASVEYAKLP